MKHPIPIPREHGAWAILYGSFLTGAGATGKLNSGILLCLVVVTGVFLAHEPLIKLVRSIKQGGRRELQRWWGLWVIVELTAAIVTGATLVFHFRLVALVPIGLFVSLLLGLHLRLSTRRKDRSIPGELIGVIGLTAAGPTAFYVGTGTLHEGFWLIWLLNVLYFASGVFYVKMRVSRFLKPDMFKRQARDCVAYHVSQTMLLTTAATTGWISWLMVLAFVPLIARAFWHTFHAEKRLSIKRIGYSEVGFTVAFIVLFLNGWRSMAG